MSELSYLKKTANVGSGSYGYTALSHDHVTASLQPLMVKHGLVAEISMIDDVYSRYEVKTRKGDTQDRYEVKCTSEVWIVNIDDPADRFKVSASAHGFDPQDKAPGKAYSMATKYCLLKLFMLASGDEEESRVEQTKANASEKTMLVDELIVLLKANKKFHEKYRSAINGLTINELTEKISENKEKK
tara:strand:- start:31 stop:591 length:561 start_codon:yes stop_codon:yes gene_type:complete